MVLGMKMLLPHFPHGTIFRDDVPPAGLIDTVLMLSVKAQKNNDLDPPYKPMFTGQGICAINSF